MSKEPDVISMTELRNSAREVIENAHFRGRQYVVERAGRPMAVILGVDDFSRLSGTGLSRQNASAEVQRPSRPDPR